MGKAVQEGICEVIFFHPEAVEEAKAGMLPEGLSVELASRFKALGNPARVRIMSLLNIRELCVCDLSAILGLSVSTISHHLKELRVAGLVRFRTEGRMAYYRLEDTPMVKHSLEAMQRSFSSLERI